jgi:hypothetical protein
MHNRKADLPNAGSASRQPWRRADLSSLPLRLAAGTCGLVFLWGMGIRTLVALQSGAPLRLRWVIFAVGSGYEIMSGCLAALLIYPIAVWAPRAGRWSAWGLVTLLVSFNYLDYVYFLRFQTHVPFSATEYLSQLANLRPSIRGAVADPAFALLVALPVLLSGWAFAFRGRVGGAARPDARPAWGWKGHAAAAGAFFLVGTVANAVSNGNPNRNSENSLVFTPLQYFINSAGREQAGPAVLSAAVLARLHPSDPDYPLLHEQAPQGCRHPGAVFGELCAGVAQAGGRPNIVFILLESFRAQEIGALGGSAGVTPHFDALARHGLLFRNFYANGTNTTDGIVASTCSLYPNTGAPIVSSYPLAKQRCLPEWLESRGYRTVWMHNGDADFHKRRGFLLRNGFERVIDQWDFAPTVPIVGWGVPDGALMDKALEVFGGLREPFFAEMLTVTNHHPYDMPPGFTAQGGDDYQRFLETMAYTDLELGRFFRRVRKEPYFRHTVFFIVADHGLPHPSAIPVETPADEIVWRHHIPLLIVADWLRTPATVDEPASQVDLAPLVADLLKARATVPWVGRSPISRGPMPADEPAALVVNSGNFVGLLGPRGAALVWSDGVWQISGRMQQASLRWAQDITLTIRWALEQSRLVPDSAQTAFRVK